MAKKDCVKHINWQQNQIKIGELLRERKRKRIDEYNKNPKKCKHCNIIIPYDEREKTFCNHSCAAAFNNLGTCRNGNPRTIFNCIECGKKLTPHQNKYCSKICCVKVHRKDKIEIWKRGELKTNDDKIPNFIREYLFDKYNNKCSECGWSKINIYTNKIPLQVHHIDGNYLNQDENNLCLLCGSCHSLTSTQGSLNNGKGRRKRRIHRAKFRLKLKQIQCAGVC